MTTSIKELYAQRCIEKDGKLVPTFWRPENIKKSPICLFGDHTRPIESGAWGVEATLRRIIALGLELEIPVGSFIREASKRDLPKSAYLKELLMSNVTDESGHYRGFVMAQESYFPDLSAEMAESIAIRKQWEQKAETYHPLLIAAVLEILIFLTTLASMRIFGGSELGRMGWEIAKDEYRHTQINYAVANRMGETLDHSDILNLVDETLAWVYGDLSVPSKEAGYDLDLDFMRQCSKDLGESRFSQPLDSLCNISTHMLPFELANSSLYSRVTEDGLVSY